MYFWSVETEIPAGNGYELFGPEHIAVLILLSIILILAVFIFVRSKEETRNSCLRTVAVALPVLEAAKIGFLTLTGHMSIGYLPLHLCSMSIFLYPVISFSGNSRVREILSEISVCTLLPAAVSALFFPDWTMYPMLSFMNIYAYLWHMLQVIFPIFCLYSGAARPHIRHLWRNTAFLLTAGLLIYAFDRAFTCNYWFLLWPVPGTPLEPMSELFGGKGYIPALLLSATAVNLCMYGILAAAGALVSGVRHGAEKQDPDHKK